MLIVIDVDKSANQALAPFFMPDEEVSNERE